MEFTIFAKTLIFSKNSKDLGLYWHQICENFNWFKRSSTFLEIKFLKNMILLIRSWNFRMIGHIYLLSWLLRDKRISFWAKIGPLLLEIREEAKDVGELEISWLELPRSLDYGIFSMDCHWHAMLLGVQLVGLLRRRVEDWQPHRSYKTCLRQCVSSNRLYDDLFNLLY